ncbi:MAG: AsmA-like C-terminal region-containing protein [Acidobacteriota bacterium]
MKKKKWILITALFFAVLVAGLFIAASVLRNRFEPYIREQAIAWLRDRFDSDVQLTSLRVHLGATSPLRLLRNRGRGTLAQVEGKGLVLRPRGRRDLPPVLSLRSFHFAIDMGGLFDSPKTIPLVTLDGMEISVPPKGERGGLTGSGPGNGGNVNIEEVFATGSTLRILPKEPGKNPLTFEIARLRLRSVGKNTAMKYEALLTNPKPPGQIHSTGTFGPWAASDPGDTPLGGSYTFDDADLGIFNGIAGILHSTGQFTGTLDSINARGEARVPDFRLKSSGHPVPLSSTFEVLVDGGNGNTVLQPVHATLGTTQFTTSGGVIRHEGDMRRTISLNVFMPAGNMEDILRLAMKGSPFMAGKLAMTSLIEIPPLEGKVREKLLLDGKFAISRGRFLRSAVQEKIDALSRRGQGEPGNEDISRVFSDMKGRFRLEDQVLSLRSLAFSTPGAAVNLAGNYNLASEVIDFHGSLALDARVSQTMTGWKHWALIPVDPFFAKNGAGTFLRIKVGGTARSPDFGLDHGHK